MSQTSESPSSAPAWRAGRTRTGTGRRGRSSPRACRRSAWCRSRTSTRSWPPTPRAGTGSSAATRAGRTIVKADDIDVVSVVVANNLHREIVERAGRGGQARAVREAARADLRRRAGDDRRGRGRGRGRPGRLHLPPDPGDRGGPGADRVRAAGPPAVHQRAVLDRLRLRPAARRSPGATAAAGLGRARGPGQPPGRHRRVPARAGRVGDRRGADHRDHRAPLPLGHVVGHAQVEVERRARAGRERRLGQLLGAVRRRRDRRPERVADRLRPPEHPQVRGLLRARARWRST